MISRSMYAAGSPLVAGWQIKEKHIFLSNQHDFHIIFLDSHLQNAYFTKWMWICNVYNLSLLAEHQMHIKMSSGVKLITWWRQCISWCHCCKTHQCIAPAPLHHPQTLDTRWTPLSHKNDLYKNKLHCQRSFTLLRINLFYFCHVLICKCEECVKNIKQNNIRQRERSLDADWTLTHCSLSAKDTSCSGSFFRSSHSMTNDWGTGWSDNRLQERYTQLEFATALNERTHRPRKGKKDMINSYKKENLYNFYVKNT